MVSLKQIKWVEKNAVQKRQVILELNLLVKSIERCEKSITDLKSELEAVNSRHQRRKTTQEDIHLQPCPSLVGRLVLNPGFSRTQACLKVLQKL